MEITQLYFRKNLLLYNEKFSKPILESKTKNIQQLLILAILVLGIGVRLFHYFNNRSLWTDEIYLASSLIRMNYRELTSPLLDYEQKAPIGFLWLVRSCVVLFGKSDMALRLIPLLTGIASLLLFLPVCRYFLKPLGVVVAMGIFALAPPLVNYAVEVKQYSMEVLVTIVALWLYIRYHKKNDIRSLLLWGLWGAILIWFSYTSVFVLAGIAMAVCLTNLFYKKWDTLFKSAIPLSLWLMSFAVYFYLYTYKQTQSDWIVNFFRFYKGFMPLPPRSGADLGWFVNTGYQMLFKPLGLLWNSSYIENDFLRSLLKIPMLGVLFLIMGIYSFTRSHKQWIMILLIPLLLHLLASGLNLYPFMGRFTLYCVPLLLLFIGRGSDTLNQRFSPRTKWQIILPVLVLAGPLVGSAMQIANPTYFGGSRHSEQREALLFIDNHYKEGDVVYVYWNMLHAYKFYRNTYGLRYKAIEGRDVRYRSKNPTEYFRNLAPDLATLAGNKRVWVIYHRKLDFNIGDDINKYPHWYSKQVIGGAKLTAAINRFGKRLLTVKTFDVDVHLFDLSRKS